MFEWEDAQRADGPIAELERTLFTPVHKYSTPLTTREIESLTSRGVIGDEAARSFSVDRSDAETATGTAGSERILINK